MAWSTAATRRRPHITAHNPRHPPETEMPASTAPRASPSANQCPPVQEAPLITNSETLWRGTNPQTKPASERKRPGPPTTPTNLDSRSHARVLREVAGDVAQREARQDRGCRLAPEREPKRLAHDPLELVGRQPNSVAEGCWHRDAVCCLSPALAHLDLKLAWAQQADRDLRHLSPHTSRVAPGGSRTSGRHLGARGAALCSAGAVSQRR
jgi:hypothetical protein